jgi:HK97 family phage prohead protease
MTDVAALFNHDPNIILSRTNGDSVTGLSLMVDSIGLKYEFKAMNKSAEMLANNIKLGFVTKSSYAYYVEDANWDYFKDAQGNEKERRTIMKISKVQDVSPVTFPAYNSTSVEARNFDHERTIKPTETTQDYILNLKLNRNENK